MPSAPAPSRSRLGRATSPVLVAGACAVVLCGLVLLAAFRAGGYYAEDFLPVGALAFAAAAAGVGVTGLERRVVPAAGVALGALLALAGWSGLSAAWSPDPGAARIEMLRLTTYTAVLLLALLAAHRRRSAAFLLRLLVGTLVVICTVALLSRLVPSLTTGDPALELVAQGRLSYPLGYWNALGAVAAMALLGCIGLVASAGERPVLRAAAAAGGVPAASVLYLTISRGAGLAFVVGLAVVLGLSPRRGRLAGASLLVITAGLLAALVLRAERVLVDRPGTVEEQADAGRAVAPLLVLIVLASGAVVFAFARREVRRRRRSHPSLPRRAPVLGHPAVIASALAIIVGVAVVVSASDGLEGRTSTGAVDVRSFLARQYDAFLDTDRPPPVGETRLASSRSTRSEAYRVALDGFGDHPLAGDGAGGYAVRWMRERRVTETFRNAHSLELEVASDLGLIGLLLLGALLVALGWGLRTVRRPRGALSGGQAAGAGGMLTVWLTHSAVDWDWQVAAVTLPALTAGALLLAPRGYARASSPGAPQPDGRVFPAKDPT